MQRLEGRVALITGGGGRIGAATALRLASEGASVVCADLLLEAAEAAADRIGGSAIGLRFDASDAVSIEKLIQQTVSHFGRLDILHNNAAVTRLDELDSDTNVLDIPVEIWDHMMVTNVRGYMVACKHAIPHMASAGGGAIINTASDAALVAEIRASLTAPQKVPSSPSLNILPPSMAIKASAATRSAPDSL